MGGGFIFVAVGLAYKPETRIEVWARDEAIARNRRLEQGLPVEMGVYYSQQGSYSATGGKWEKPRVGRAKLVE